MFLRIVDKTNSGLAPQVSVFKENFQNRTSRFFSNHETMEMLEETDIEYIDSMCCFVAVIVDQLCFIDSAKKTATFRSDIATQCTFSETGQKRTGTFEEVSLLLELVGEFKQNTKYCFKIYRQLRLCTTKLLSY